jgi:transcriptional regulator with GAF, ATPase, and Fis domain
MAELIALKGMTGLSRFPLDQEIVVIGRAASVDIALTDRNASGSHCRIRHEKGRHVVYDLDSQNGTWVNGKRIRRRILKGGDVLAIGKTQLRYGDDGSTKELPEAGPHDVELRRLRKLVAWVRRLNNERDVRRLLALMLDSVIELSGAERGFLYILDDSGKLRIRVAKGFDSDALEKPSFKVTRALAAEVARKGRAVVSASAEDDPRIRSLGDTGELNLRSVAAVPIRAGERLLGALYLDNRFERGLFSDEDLPFLLSFADHAAVALENARLHEEAKAARTEVEELNKALRGRVENQERALHDAQARYARAMQEAKTKYGYENIIGKSPAMRELFFLLDRVTDSDVPVYVSGESGSGKELCARAIHVHGPRGDAPFVAENCAAIPESLFESELFGHKRGSFTGATADRTGLFRLADGGTLFLDEIGELPLPLQAKLLRVLQEQQVRPIGAREPVAVDVRIITASNRDLADRVRRGQFRADLYHRIHVIEIPVPPLRRRIEDLPLLTDHILGRIGNGEPLSLSPAALDLLSRYEWPGNVRELENELLRAATLAPGLDGDEIGPEAFSESVRAAQGSLSARFRGQTLKDAVKEATREVERELVTEALRREKGNKSAAARRLGVSRPTLDAKMESLKIPRYPA